MEEAKSTGPTLLQRMVKLHYNWKYPFLRPTIESVVQRYNQKFGFQASSSSSAALVPPAGAAAAAAAAAPAAPDAAAGIPPATAADAAV